MPARPTNGDFVVECVPESAHYVVRREGATISNHRFESYAAAIAFALNSADDHDAHAFVKGTAGWICLSR